MMKEKNQKKLPEGTVTFLFTDIEGSTRLLHRLGDQYDTLLTDQRWILREEFKRWGGQEIDTQGDSFFACFQKASDAVAAAADIQQIIADHSWPEGIELRLRMGLHTGEPLVAQESYIGIDVHRAARVAALGHGGQVLLSETTAALVCDQLPEGVSLKALGEYRLKDFDRPEPVSQLVIPGLLAEFPALKSPGVRPIRLPTPSTPFIGRRAEIDKLCGLINDPEVRLVTILGPGGMGKTRLAIASAQELDQLSDRIDDEAVPQFPDGIFFVPLAPVEASNRLVPAIAKSVGFQFYEGVEPRQQLLDFLHTKEILLVLDNFEHLLDDAQLVTEILEASPEIKILVTSREKLRLTSETIFPLHGMDFPEPASIPQEELTEISDRYSAVGLFIQTTRKETPELEITRDDLHAIAQICALVDGMPLGVEIAAGWSAVLSSNAIAARIQEQLDFLETDRRDVPERHRSMRAVFSSMWTMLTRREQQVFRGLSVFRGGFTQEAAEYVVRASPEDLRNLTNKSLIQRTKDERYAIHELLRQYAEEKLENDQVERDDVRDLHCAFFTEFLHQRENEIDGGDNSQALLEMDNIERAWKWAVLHDKIPEIRKQAHSLWILYDFQGWHEECVEVLGWAANLLRSEEPGGEKGIAYGQVLAYLGYCTAFSGNRKAGIKHISESQAILTQLDASLEFADANMLFGFLCNPDAYSAAKEKMLASLDIFEEGDVHWVKADLLNTLGEIAYAETDYHGSQNYHHQALQIGRALNNRRILGWSSLGLAPIAREKEEFERARELFEKSYEYHADIGYKIPSAASLMHLGDTLILLGDYAEAEVCYQKALAINQDIAFQAGIGYSIYGFGDIAFAMGQYERAYQHYEEALNLFRIIGDRYGVIARLLSDLGKVAVAMDDPDDAKKRFREAFHIEQHDQYARTCLAIVEGFSEFLAKSGELARAVELCSLVVSHPKSDIFIRRGASKRLEECMELLSPNEFMKARERGKDLNLRITAEKLLAALGD